MNTRFKWHRNEKAAIILLRRQGYTTTGISNILGRSPSLIHRVLKFNALIGALAHVDLRKIPAQLRLRTAQKQRIMSSFYAALWMPFVFGEADKPP